MLDDHVQRLYEHAKLKGLNVINSYTIYSLKDLIAENIGKLLDRIIVLITNQEIMFLTCSNSPVSKYATVKLAFGSRHEPNVKNTRWISERKNLEAIKGNCSEVVMKNENGCITEGLVTNFFVLCENNGVYHLETAPENSVLEGTTLKKVLQLSDVPILRTFPLVENLKTWKGAFICNAFRGIQIIKSIDNDGEIVDFDTNNEILCKLQAKISKALNIS